jgi:peptide/nickel transport system ATP-binding protein
MADALLSVRNLSVQFTTYGQTNPVLKGVSLDVPARSQIALVGESGSGKTVTMRAIMGLLRSPPAKVTGGEIFYDGRDLLTMPDRERLKLRGTAMSMVFQDPMSSLNPVFTIADQMGTILKYADRRLGRSRDRKARMARVHEVLGQVRMRDPERVARSYPIMLSGGMRQRVLIAMALLSEPKLLIADEPGTALDVTTQAQILKLLKDLVEERGLALLMITHNLGRGARNLELRLRDEQGRGGRAPADRRTLRSAARRLHQGADRGRTPAHRRNRLRQQGSGGMSAMLEIAGLTKLFPVRNGFGRKTGDVRAVDEVSFSIPKGKVYGLAGESGSGKSTIARMIMGLAKPTSGDIRLDGHSIIGETGTRAYGRKVQMVFQNPGSSLNPRRTVGQSIAVPLAAHGTPGGEHKRRIAELLEMVQLPADFALRYPHELSGGQKQRVAIARALAVAPQLLILDEPTSALDVSVQARVMDLLVDLGRQLGLTYLFISHDLSLMRNFADTVGVLYLGKIVETGSTASVFEAPQHDYTRLLLASVPVISAEEEAMRPKIPLIDGEIPTAEQLIALRGGAAAVSQRIEK